MARLPFAVAIISGLIAAPAFAHGVPVRSFLRDGVSYHYAVDAKDGRGLLPAPRVGQTDDIKRDAVAGAAADTARTAREAQRPTQKN